MSYSMISGLMPRARKNALALALQPQVVSE
jgi:hypothetical protein